MLHPSLQTTEDQRFYHVDSPRVGKGLVLLTKTTIRKALSYTVETIELDKKHNVPVRIDIGYISAKTIPLKTGKAKCWTIFDRDGDSAGIHKTWQEAVIALIQYFA